VIGANLPGLALAFAPLGRLPAGAVPAGTGKQFQVANVAQETARAPPIHPDQQKDRKEAMEKGLTTGLYKEINKNTNKKEKKPNKQGFFDEVRNLFRNRDEENKKDKKNNKDRIIARIS
jgi:hypothetical protein